MGFISFDPPSLPLGQPGKWSLGPLSTAGSRRVPWFSNSEPVSLQAQAALHGMLTTLGTGLTGAWTVNLPAWVLDSGHRYQLWVTSMGKEFTGEIRQPSRSSGRLGNQVLRPGGKIEEGQPIKNAAPEASLLATGGQITTAGGCKETSLHTPSTFQVLAGTSAWPVHVMGKGPGKGVSALLLPPATAPRTLLL